MLPWTVSCTRIEGQKDEPHRSWLKLILFDYASGYVGIIPALGMLTPEDNPPDGPVLLNNWQLVLWSLALAYIGVFSAVPLRMQTIVREKLRFPSGAATAKVIQLMHVQDSSVGYAHLGGEEAENEEEDRAQQQQPHNDLDVGENAG